MSQEAASLIKLFYGSDMPPYDVGEKLSEWIGRWENLKEIRKVTMDVADAKIESDFIRQLKKEVDKVGFYFRLTRAFCARESWAQTPLILVYERPLSVPTAVSQYRAQDYIRID